MVGSSLCYPVVALPRKDTMISNVVAPAIAGIVLATVALFGLVSAQTAAPSQNPASQEIIVYGDR